jgi:NACalpha-BTF3-like transcription factor
LPSWPSGEGWGDDISDERGCAMSEPTSSTRAAGEGLSDEEMVETVAEQTDSASENADTAGKDWNGDPSDAPAPTD